MHHALVYLVVGAPWSLRTSEKQLTVSGCMYVVRLLQQDVVNGFPGADFVRLPAPGVSIVCKSQRAVQWLLSDGFNNNTKASQHENPVSYLLGEFIGHDGIFRLRHGNQTPELSRDHEKWLHQRKQASKVFTRRAFNDLMHTVFKAKSLEFAGLLDAHCGSDNADDALDMQELYSAVSTYVRTYENAGHKPSSVAHISPSVRV
jgi:cytochrome P450